MLGISAGVVSADLAPFVTSGAVKAAVVPLDLVAGLGAGLSPNLLGLTEHTEAALAVVIRERLLVHALGVDALILLESLIELAVLSEGRLPRLVDIIEQLLAVGLDALTLALDDPPPVSLGALAHFELSGLGGLSSLALGLLSLPECLELIFAGLVEPAVLGEGLVPQGRDVLDERRAVLLHLFALTLGDATPVAVSLLEGRDLFSFSLSARLSGILEGLLLGLPSLLPVLLGLLTSLLLGRGIGLDLGDPGVAVPLRDAEALLLKLLEVVLDESHIALAGPAVADTGGRDATHGRLDAVVCLLDLVGGLRAFVLVRLREKLQVVLNLFAGALELRRRGQECIAEVLVDLLAEGADLAGDGIVKVELVLDALVDRLGDLLASLLAFLLDDKTGILELLLHLGVDVVEALVDGFAEIALEVFV